MLLSIYLAAFVFVIVLVVAAVFAIYVYFKSKPLRKEMVKRQAEFAEARSRGETGGRTIDADYVVVEETTVDPKPKDQR